MKNYTVKRQRTFSNGTETTNIEEIKITADSYQFEEYETLVTEDNIHLAQRSGFKIGDVLKSARISIMFISNNEIIKQIGILGDPSFELYEEGNDTPIEIHNCINHS